MLAYSLSIAWIVVCLKKQTNKKTYQVLRREREGKKLTERDRETKNERKEEQKERKKRKKE